MKRKKTLVFWIIVLAIVVALFFLVSGKQQPVRHTVAPPPAHVALSAEARRDLARDEERGGHTLERHIGKTDAELRERLESESISADSTYSNRDTAEMAVAAAIRENASRIDAWLHRPGGHSNLVLDYVSDTPLGRSMRRGETTSFSCSHAVVILKWAGPSDYFVLTSYPECWRPQ